MLRGLWLVPVLFILLVACTPEANNQADNGPQLVLEVTIPPTEIRATRFLSPTPTVPATATFMRSTAELNSPLDNVTVDAQYVIVTPTLPPSKTPTVTPTHSPTPTITPTPSLTNTSTSTAFLLPTSIVIPITEPAADVANRVCDSTWGFIYPPPESCPLGAPVASQGVYQEFSNGYMVWVGSMDAIYVLFKDDAVRRWEVKRDFFDESNPSMAYLDAAPQSLGAGMWNPRRGFGLLWEQDAYIKNRIGGATQQWEQPFSVQVQTASDGTLFVTTPRGTVFGLMSGGISWDQFTGSLPPQAPTAAVQALPPPENAFPIFGGK